MGRLPAFPEFVPFPDSLRSSTNPRDFGVFNAVFPEFLPRWDWSLILVTLMILYVEIGGFKAMVYSDAVK